MTINFRNYINETRFGADYDKVRDFIVRVNRDHLINPNFTWERWVWMISRATELEHDRTRIGIWEKDSIMVGLATFEDDLSRFYAVVDSEYPEVYAELVAYVASQRKSDKPVFLNIFDQDLAFQEAARRYGFCPTPEREYVAKQSLRNRLSFDIDPQFHLLSMDEEWDYREYNRVMWLGFNHDGEPDQSEEMLAFRKTMLSSPHLNKDLTVVVSSDDGHYQSHAGIWYQEGDDYANIEPVATIPEARRKGLAKACIYYALNRARAKGAKYALIGSEQPFYYRIGFNPCYSFSWWRLD